jgi:hypothetical protein
MFRHVEPSTSVSETVFKTLEVVPANKLGFRVTFVAKQHPGSGRALIPTGLFGSFIAFLEEFVEKSWTPLEKDLGDINGDYVCFEAFQAVTGDIHVRTHKGKGAKHLIIPVDELDEVINALKQVEPKISGAVRTLEERMASVKVEVN